MTKINGKAEWSEVDIFENEDILTGGEEGSANKQAQALTNRTEWLKEHLVERVNGKKIAEKSVIITAEDILVKGKQTIQEELEQKSNRDHTHAFGGGAPEVTPEMVGKYLGVNAEGTGTEWVEVKELPGMRLWESKPLFLLKNGPVLDFHGLNIAPNECKCDALIICREPDRGYLKGEQASNAGTYYGGMIYPLIPALYKDIILLGVGMSLSMFDKAKNTMVHAGVDLAKWDIVFRIWY